MMHTAKSRRHEEKEQKGQQKFEQDSIKLSGMEAPVQTPCGQPVAAAMTKGTVTCKNVQPNQTELLSSDTASSKILPCPGKMHGSRKRRAFASNGPLAKPPMKEFEPTPHHATFKMFSSLVTPSKPQDSSHNSSEAGLSNEKLSPPKKMYLSSPPCSPGMPPFGTPPQPTSNFKLSPISNELSNFGNLNLQSPGSSFTSYSRSPLIPCPSAPVKGTPPYPSPLQTRRIVPVSMVSVENCQNFSNSSELEEPGCIEGQPLSFGSPQVSHFSTALTPEYKQSPRFLLPRCSKNSRLNQLIKKNGSPSPRVQSHYKASPSKKKPVLPAPQLKIDTNVDEPPVENVTLDRKLPASTKSLHKEARPIAFRSLLRKGQSVDSLDSFGFHNDDASNGSLTDDDGEWFFLCDPVGVAKASDQDSKKSRGVLPQSSPSASITTSDRSSSTRLDVLSPSASSSSCTAGMRRSNSTRSAYTSSNSLYTSCNSLFGMGIIREDSTQELRKSSIETLAINPQDSFGPKVQHAPNHFNRTESDVSLSLGLENAPMYGTNRDMITPPVITTSDPKQPPPIKKTRLSEHKFKVNDATFSWPLDP